MAQISQLHRMLTRMARQRMGYVLDLATVERVCNLWCEKHRYRDWQMHRCLFEYAFAVWIFDPEYRRGHAWHRLYAEIDIALEPPTRRCLFCGEWIWREHPSRCDSRSCRAAYAFYFLGRSWPRNTPRGDEGMGPFLLADFLKRMARPKSPRDLEFSKRYSHRASKARTEPALVEAK